MRFQRQDFNVGWIAAKEIEYTIAIEQLDEEYRAEDCPHLKQNTYRFGRVRDHNVVIACLSQGRVGISHAAVLAHQMRENFGSLHIVLMVGIGGGAPSWQHDIRLGDVVVSTPGHKHGGIIQYDFGKAIQDREFDICGQTAAIPSMLLETVVYLEAQDKRESLKLNAALERIFEKPRPSNRAGLLRSMYGRPDPRSDRLYASFYVHSADGRCDCQAVFKKSQSKYHESELKRQQRESMTDDPVIHYGLVASANTVVKDANLRDALIKKLDVLCFDMEAAGLLDGFPCLVIRGISDYSDSHKNDLWQGYAAAMAACYAKKVLTMIHLNRSATASDVASVVSNSSSAFRYSVPSTTTTIKSPRLRPESLQTSYANEKKYSTKEDSNPLPARADPSTDEPKRGSANGSILGSKMLHNVWISAKDGAKQMAWAAAFERHEKDGEAIRQGAKYLEEAAADLQEEASDLSDDEAVELASQIVKLRKLHKFTSNCLEDDLKRWKNDPKVARHYHKWREHKDKMIQSAKEVENEAADMVNRRKSGTSASEETSQEKLSDVRDRLDNLYETAILVAQWKGAPESQFTPGDLSLGEPLKSRMYRKKYNNNRSRNNRSRTRSRTTDYSSRSISPAVVKRQDRTGSESRSSLSRRSRSRSRSRDSLANYYAKGKARWPRSRYNACVESASETE